MLYKINKIDLIYIIRLINNYLLINNIYINIINTKNKIKLYKICIYLLYIYNNTIKNNYNNLYDNIKNILNNLNKNKSTKNKLKKTINKSTKKKNKLKKIIKKSTKNKLTKNKSTKNKNKSIKTIQILCNNDEKSLDRYKLARDKYYIDKSLFNNNDIKNDIKNNKNQDINFLNINKKLYDKILNFNIFKQDIDIENIIFKYNIFEYDFKYNNYDKDDIFFNYIKELIKILNDDINDIEYLDDYNIMIDNKKEYIKKKIKNNNIYIKLGGIFYGNIKINRIFFIKKVKINDYNITIIDLYNRKIYELSNIDINKLILILDYDCICHTDLGNLNKIDDIKNYLYNIQKKNDENELKTDEKLDKELDKYKKYMKKEIDDFIQYDINILFYNISNFLSDNTKNKIKEYTFLYDNNNNIYNYIYYNIMMVIYLKNNNNISSNFNISSEINIIKFNDILKLDYIQCIKTILLDKIKNNDINYGDDDMLKQNIFQYIIKKYDINELKNNFLNITVKRIEYKEEEKKDNKKKNEIIDDDIYIEFSNIIQEINNIKYINDYNIVIINEIIDYYNIKYNIKLPYILDIILINNILDLIEKLNNYNYNDFKNINFENLKNMLIKLKEKNLNSFVNELLLLLITKININTIPTDTILNNINDDYIKYYYNNDRNKKINIINRLRSKYDVFINNINIYKNINIEKFELLILMIYNNEDDSDLSTFLNKIFIILKKEHVDYERSILEQNIEAYNNIIKLDTKINNIKIDNNKNIKLDILKINNFKTIIKNFISNNDNKINYEILYYNDTNNIIRFYENSVINYNYDILKLIYEKIDNNKLLNYIKNNIGSSYIDILLINTYIYDNNIKNEKDIKINNNEYENIIKLLDENSLFKRIYEGDIKYVIEYFQSSIENYEKIDKSLLNIIINIYNKKKIINNIINYNNNTVSIIKNKDNKNNNNNNNNNNNIENKDNDIDQDYINNDVEIYINFKNNNILSSNFVIIDHNKINNFVYLKKLMSGLHNGFLFQDIKKDEYFIFILLNDKILKNINDNKKKSYFVEKEYKIQNINVVKTYLIKIKFINVLFDFQNDEELYALYISFIINRNQIGIILLHKMVKNVYEKNKILKNNILYQNIIGAIVENKLNIDISYTNELFNNNYEKINLNNNENSIQLNKKIENNYKIISNISKLISDNKEDFILDEKLNNDKYSKLKEFITNFRSKCKSKSKSKNIIGGNNDEDINIYIIEKFLEYDKENRLLNIANIIIEKKDYYYNKMINIKYNSINNNLENINIQNMKNLNINYINNNNIQCQDILKYISELDNYLIKPLSDNRTLDIILFELISGNIIRKDQDNVLKEINYDIIIGKYDKVYEILMGRGKTSTITPLIILNNYLFNNNIDQYNIILPNSLVVSSFDILKNLLYVMNDYEIKVNNFTIQKNIINIASDENIKKKIINYVQNNNINEIYKIKNVNPLYIFDETDSIINPLKSNLNIPLKPQNHENKQVIIDNLMKKYYYDENIILNEKNEDEKILKNKIEQINNKVENMKYNKNYGFGTYDNSKKLLENKNYFIAIPYTYNNSPLNGSEFTDYELAITLTILSYKNYFENNNNNFRIEDIFLLMYELNIKDFQDEDYIKNNLLLDKIYNNDNDYINFIKQNINIFEDDIEINNKIKYEININNINNIINTLQNNYKDYINKLQYIYITIILDKFFKISKKQYNISMIDIYNHIISPKKISFSGTINFISPSETIFDILCNTQDNINLYFSQIFEYKNDDVVGSAIEASVYGITTNKPLIELYDVYTYNKKLSDEDIEENLINYLKNNINNYQALIDSGGLILNKTVDDIVDLIKVNTKIEQVEYILYINSKHERIVYDRKKDIKYNYNNDIYDNIFIYYDNQHCVGIDFKQPPNMKGLITINQTSIITDVSQGIYRLRNINIGHYVDFYFPKLNKDYKKIDKFYIYDFLKENEEKNKEQTKIYMIIQCINNINRFSNNQININGFKENVYYETIKYDNKYLSYKDFMIKKIEKIPNLDDEKILKYIENIEKKDTNEINVQQNVAVQQNIQIMQYIEPSIKINKININQYIYFKDFLELNENIDYDNKNNDFLKLNKNVYKINYKNIEYEYILSPSYYVINNNFIINKNDNLKVYKEGSYFIKNNKNKNKIYIITLFDYLNILQYLNKQSNDKNKYIEIYDNNFNIVYPKNKKSSLITEDEKYLYGLLITDNIIDTKNEYKKMNPSIIMYIYSKIDQTKNEKTLEYLQYIFDNNYQFDINIKVNNDNIKLKNTWEKLFNYYNLSDDTFKLYFKKYKFYNK